MSAVLSSPVSSKARRPQFHTTERRHLKPYQIKSWAAGIILYILVGLQHSAASKQKFWTLRVYDTLLLLCAKPILRHRDLRGKLEPARVRIENSSSPPTCA